MFNLLGDTGFDFIQALLQVSVHALRAPACICVCLCVGGWVRVCVCVCVTSTSNCKHVAVEGECMGDSCCLSGCAGVVD